MLQTCIKNRLIRRGIVALALLAVLLGIPVAAAQTFDEAVVAYERRDYATAIRGFRVHAEQGTAEAQCALGVMYAFGEGVLKDDAEAVKWYRLAAEQGVASAQYTLGRMYATGAAFSKTMPKPRNGTDWLPSRAQPMRSTPSGSVTVLGWAFSRTMPKP